jgi:hypothetical protein
VSAFQELWVGLSQRKTAIFAVQKDLQAFKNKRNELAK